MARDTKLMHYLVAFVDILGQQAKLRQLDTFPESDEDRRRTLEVLKETAGAVVKLRRYFASFFERLQREQTLFFPLLEEQKARTAQLRRIAVHTRGFSDAFVVAVPLAAHDEGLIPMVSVSAALEALAAMTLVGLADHIPLRAGVEIGLGLDITQDGGEPEIYGPALGLAYELESKVAERARIAAGQELVTYIDRSTLVEGEELELDVTRHLAARVQQSLLAEPDGVMVLDYLRLTLESRPPHSWLDRAPSRLLAKKAHTFATLQRQRWQAEKNLKLETRWAATLDYFDSRRSLWASSEHSA